jgi:hypothetical protein
VGVFSGRDYPDNLKEYRLIIHCGGCMLNRREMPAWSSASPQPWIPFKGKRKESARPEKISVSLGPEFLLAYWHKDCILRRVMTGWGKTNKSSQLVLSKGIEIMMSFFSKPFWASRCPPWVRG